MTQGRFVALNAQELAVLPLHQQVTVRETDPENGKYCEVKVERTDPRLVRIRLRDWPGHRFELSVDLVENQVRLIAPKSESRPSWAQLTRSTFEMSLQLFRHEPILV